MHTELVFVLDKSGSMAGLEKDTVGGYNSILKKQLVGEGTVTITTVLFDHDIELLHDRLPVDAVELLTENDYVVGGMTALMDAVGFAINKIDKVQQSIKNSKQADKVLFVITTDGMENSSKKYSAQQIKSLITAHKEKGWEFLFLGANIDVEKFASSIGISEEHAVEYIADEVGTYRNFEVLNETVSTVRQGHKITRGWKKTIEEDAKTRIK
ncbi:MAG: vWA domain-containing protein [Lysinibacillus sp.]